MHFHPDRLPFVVREIMLYPLEISLEFSGCEPRIYIGNRRHLLDSQHSFSYINQANPTHFRSRGVHDATRSTLWTILGILAPVAQHQPSIAPRPSPLGVVTKCLFRNRHLRRSNLPLPAKCSACHPCCSTRGSRLLPARDVDSQGAETRNLRALGLKKSLPARLQRNEVCGKDTS